ncbi:MAG: lamin tail domain-containing protein [Clostridia bacterium]|nr:lamin tail domain-containing protein [Clostridia bacterium]
MAIKLRVKRHIRITAVIVLSAAVLLACILFSSSVSGRLEAAHVSASSFPVCINEIMASNVRYANSDGVFCDWVELYNGSDSQIDIGGYKLTDKSNEARYTIPADTVIPAGGYYIIYCMRDAPNSGYADFGISSNGDESITLMNTRNVLVDTVDTVALQENQVMARIDDGTWAVLDYATPAYENSQAGYLEFSENRTVAGSEVRISEVVASNSFYYNADGISCDYIELHNSGSVDFNVSGYMLTDKEQDIRFVFDSAAVIPAGGYLTVWCTRAPAQVNALERYADFSISRSGGEELLLINPDMQVVDRFLTVAAQRNTAQVRGEGGAIVQISYATPNYPNTAAGYEQYLQTRFLPNANLYISEVMAENNGYPDPSGRLLDFIELHNRSDQTLDLSGYGLSDSPGDVLFSFPSGTTLAPDGYIVVYCESGSSETSLAPFGIATEGGETLVLTDSLGVCVDAVATLAVEGGQSMVRQEDGTFALEALATPAYPNDENGYAAYLLSVATQPSTLRISELMSNNGATLPDSRGVFSDWIELTNVGSAAVDLNQFYLTDDALDPYQFRLPERTLGPNEYVLVFCSGLNTVLDGEIHAPFRLSASGETVGLYSAYGELLQSVTVTAEDDDRSFVVEADGSVTVTAYPTPNRENTPAEYANLLAERTTPNSLVISEVMPSNRSYLRQRGGEYYDWVELMNCSSARLNIGGFRLSTDSDSESGFVLPNVTLAPGETYIVICSGDASLVTSTENACHAALSLNAVEDRLFLYDAGGALIDYMRLYNVPADGSIGRLPDRSGIYILDTPTPKSENESGDAVFVPSAEPTSNVSEGVYEGVSHLDVSLFAEGDIYYTLDGSLPTTASTVYMEPIRIEKTQIIRAISCEPDKSPSKPLTLSYIINEGHTLPVVSLVADPDDLFGRTTGIYSNPQEEWERAASVSFFDGDSGFSIDCGVRISGQTSRGREHKSFKLLFAPRYEGRLEYDLYEDYKVNTFSSLLLRSGLDGKYAIIREPFFTQLALPYKDTTLAQNSRMAVVYINGEYYGLYMVMEAYSEEFYADYFDVSPESVTIIKGYLYDDELEIYQLLKFAAENDMSVEENYRYLEERVDFDSLIDWAIFQAYVSNDDLSANVRYIKCSELENKWQFAYYDVECGMGYSLSRDLQSFEFVFNRGQTRMIFVPLLNNAEFRDKFLTRLAYHCRVTFDTENVLGIFESLVADVEGEVPRNRERWDYPNRIFENNIVRIRSRITDYDRAGLLIEDIAKRLSLTQEELDHYFGDLINE